MSTALLPAKERDLLGAVARCGRILTRIKEHGDRDVEFIQLPSMNLQSKAGEELQRLAMADDDILTCLHALEGRGLLTTNVTAYNASTTEYVCEWTPRDAR